MKNSMRDLISLNVHFRDRPHLAGPVADHLRSEEYRKNVEALGNDPKELARLTGCLLKHVSLDPLVGKRLEDFVNPFNVESEEYYFYLPLNRVVNFLGNFSLRRDSAEARALLQAIQENLNSKMFKAASMHRRLDQARLRHERRLTARAKAAYEDSLAQSRRNATPYHGNLTAAERRQEEAQWTAMREAANAAHDAVYVEPHARMNRRIRAVGELAFDQDFRAGYTEILIAFAARYLCPQYYDDSAILAA